jgi:N-acetylglucosamine-6-phosphate deacetylase
MFYKKNGVGRTDKHHLCGSALLLPDMVRNFVKFTGVKPARAIQCATLNPAAQMKMADDIGLIAPGRRADLALWTNDLKLRGVWRNGTPLATVSDFAEIH